MGRVDVVSSWFLAAVFLFAAVDKAFHYEGFLNALSSYPGMPAAAVGYLAPVLILAELWVGIGLLLARWRRPALAFAAALLALFTVAVLLNYVFAPESICGCWFSLTLGTSSGLHILQNLALLGLALSTWWSLGRSPRPDGPPPQPYPDTLDQGADRTT